MDPGELLIQLVHKKDPLDIILRYVEFRFLNLMSLQDIGESYERLEEQLCEFEKWLDDIWGMAFYRLLSEGAGGRALAKAYRMAGQRGCNILVADGLSLRELLLLLRAFPGRVEYEAGYAFHPTTTLIAARSFYGQNTLDSSFQGRRLIEGYEWSGSVVTDTRSPPKVGGRTGIHFLTYYPDAPLHNAVKYGVAMVQDVSQVMSDLIYLISELTLVSDLVVTGDHGYIYLGKSPNKYLWRWIGRSDRHGGNYGVRTLEVDGETMATGRCDCPDVRQSGAFIVHGGASLTESLVPVILVRRSPE